MSHPETNEISAGGEHTLFRNPTSGNLFSTGACGLGWCRLFPMTPDHFKFQRVPLPEPCRLFHASYYHNIAVGAVSGRLYTWGCGTFTEGCLDGSIPALGQGVKADDRGGPAKAIEIVLPNGASNIKDVTGGAYHSCILTNSGKVLTFGAGQLGQLGRELTSTSYSDSSGLPVDPVPREVAGIPSDEQVTNIGAGFYNTFARCKSGALYCTGENQNHQCGHVQPQTIKTMTKVDCVKDVKRAEGGYCHTLIQTVKGSVFALGCGEDGQRGDGQASDHERGLINNVKLPHDETVTQIAAGANHSVLLGKSGTAYAFGANDVGQCGVSTNASHNPHQHEEEEEEEGDPVLAPTAVNLPKEAGKVTNISAGYAHTVLTTSSGKLFVFGQNDNGQLGIGIEKEQDIQRTPVLVQHESIRSDATV